MKRDQQDFGLIKIAKLHGKVDEVKTISMSDLAPGCLKRRLGVGPATPDLSDCCYGVS